MSFKGMDPERMGAFAAELEANARQMRDAHGRLTSTVHATPWFGPAAERFVSDWQGVHAAKVHAAATVLSELATRLRGELKQQLSASGAGGGHLQPVAGVVHGGPANAPGAHPVKPFTAAVVADTGAAKKAMALANGVMHSHAAQYFPGAVAALAALEAKMGTPPTAVQVEALRRMASLIRIAQVQRETVHEAADLAVESLKDAGKSQIAAVKDAFDVTHPGGSLTQAPKILGEEMGKDALKGFASAEGTDIATGTLLGAAMRGTPDVLLQAYDLQADKMLAGFAQHAGSVTELGAAHDGVAFQSADVLSGRLQTVQLQGIAADSTHMITGDGSPVQTAATAILGSMPDGIGQVYSGLSAVANEAHAGMEVSVALGAIRVANVDSLIGLDVAARNYGLG